MVIEAGTATGYTHTEPGTNIRFGIAGYYVPLEETRLPYNGREVLYVTGKVNIEAACCDLTKDWVYAIVPGYILEWQASANENGEKVSLVEPVRSSKEKEAVRKAIIEKEGMVPVDFW